MEIVYEYAKTWPKNGPLNVTVPSVTMNIPVSPDTARRRANGYLGVHVGLLLGSSDPRLIVGDPPIWKLGVNLHLPSIGYIGQVGTIEVDAQTGDVLPVSADVIESIKVRANDLIVHFAPETKPAS